MKKQIIIALATVTALTSFAAARNTEDDWKWKSTYYKSYGEWTTACEDRTDDATVKRCYLRYLDGYAQDPFGAFFLFVTANPTGASYEFEFERRTDFNANWSIKSNDKEIWSFEPTNCPLLGPCVINFDGQQSDELAKALSMPEASISFDFTDREDRKFERTWPAGQNFVDALNDLQNQSTDRALF